MFSLVTAKLIGEQGLECVVNASTTSLAQVGNCSVASDRKPEACRTLKEDEEGAALSGPTSFSQIPSLW